MYALSNYMFVQNILEHTFWKVGEMLKNMVKKGHFFYPEKLYFVHSSENELNVS